MGRKIPSGSIYKPKYTDRHGKRQESAVWWMKFYLPGRSQPERRSTGEADEAAAIKVLRKAMVEGGFAAIAGARPETVTMNDLFDLVVARYRRKKQGLADLERKLDFSLRPRLGKLRASQITSRIIDDFINTRCRDTRGKKEKKRPITPATVNRDLSIIRLALNLGAQQEPPLVLKVPKFELLKEADPREGILDRRDYTRFKALLPEHARLAFVIAYHTGARRGEILKIKVSDVEMHNDRIRRPGRVTKNGKTRYLPIYGDMRAEISAAILGRGDDEPLVRYRETEVTDIKTAWQTARIAAKLPNLLFHDMRRTALTMMIEAGLSEKEAMEISGHKTRAVFDRYHIVSPERLRAKAQDLERHLEGLDEQVQAPKKVAGQSRGQRQTIERRKKA
jgi:integrase